MNLPEQPSAFRRPHAAERPWAWLLRDAADAAVDAGEGLGDQRFVSQADAESWVGETWQELAAAGVDRVTLVEHDRVVYGPMSLRG